MRIRSMIGTAMSLLLLATPLFAQGHMQHMQQQPAQHAQMQGMGGMQACMDMMGGPSAAMILQHRQTLGLSAQQVDRLDAIGKQDSTAVAPHMREAMAAHEAVAQILRADRPDFAAYEAKLQEAAHHAILGHVAAARLAVDARDVLTPDQRTRLQTAMKSGGGMMGNRSMQGMHGMMQGGGMMMDCPMMGGMQGAAAGAAHDHSH